MATCYVGNVAWATTNEDLAASFNAAGARSVELQVHADTGRAKGFALVKFATPKEAEAFIATYNLFEIHDRGEIYPLCTSISLRAAGTKKKY